MSRAGYVLAGGRSSRMGTDKALLRYRGATLVEGVAREVEAAAGSVVIVGREDGFAGFRAIPDLYPGEGPLGGILSALHHTTADWNLILACDLPEVRAQFLRQLLESAQGDGLVPVGPSGRAEPLCAVYHRQALPALEAAFQRGVRQVTAALGEGVGFFPIPGGLHNINTPEDWARHGN